MQIEAEQEVELYRIKNIKEKQKKLDYGIPGIL